MKPYYEEPGIAIYNADCRDVLPHLGPVDLVLTDPPYGDTSLDWDEAIDGWPQQIGSHLSPPGSMWVFGSFRYFCEHYLDFMGWKLAQDLVWEKHNGSNFHADRFKRVHEHIAQFYRGDWECVYRDLVTTPDAVARCVRRKQGPTHTGKIDAARYVSEDGGPRLMRSVIYARSCHGEAVHPTQKPIPVIEPIIRYSSPPNALILDPFMGSGTTLVAAKQLGRRAIGIEIERKYCDIAVDRLRQAVLPLEPVEAQPEQQALLEADHA